MDPLLAFDFWGLQLPVPVALAAVALVGYLAGNFRRRSSDTGEPVRARRELKRAQAVIQQLEQVSKEIRMNLATHQASILRFKDRLTLLNTSQESATWNDLCHEAERMLGPTMQLANQMANAYDEIRQQTNLLMSFSEVRTDPLTGLSNRRALDETMKQLFALFNRYGNSFSIVLFDIDYFKQVNDEFGHLEGDRLLQQFGLLLDKCVRVSDIATRYGGEEFVVLMPETDLQGASIFAERMRARIAEELPMTVSGGVAEARRGEDMRAMLARCDSALYSSKATGRNRVFVHSGEEIEAVGDILDLEMTTHKGDEQWPELATKGRREGDLDSTEEQLEALAEEVDEVAQSARAVADATSQLACVEEEVVEAGEADAENEPSAKRDSPSVA